MRIWILLVGFLAVLATPADAQIFAVSFKSEKAAKKYKKHLINYRGAQVVIGEAKSGIVWKPAENSVNYQGQGNNELFVPDPAKPGITPYKFKDGEMVPVSGKNTVSISGVHIDRVSILMRDETLAGLAKEYRIRDEQIEEFRSARDRHDKTSTDWSLGHVRLVTAMERLERWLDSTAFPQAAGKLRKQIARENKAVRGEAIRARGQKAIDSIQAIEVPEELVSLSKEISEGRHKFSAQQSQHVRIYYIDKLSDAEISDALKLAEEIIEGFRAEFVDPYLDEDFEDYVPDDLFQEFLFTPESDKAFGGYGKGMYGMGHSDPERQRQLLEMGGSRSNSSFAPFYRNIWKVRDQFDLSGIICHALGHSLAALHYGNGRKVLQQDWLEESLGYYISFEHLGRNNVTCKQFHDPEQGYRKRVIEKKEGDKTVETGRREVYNEVALTKGRPIDQLALKILFEMDDADLAKAWSFFDYIARKEGKPGQEWLRGAGEFATKRDTFVLKWRERAASVLGVDMMNAFKAIEDRWKAYAGGAQDTSDAPRRKR